MMKLHVPPILLLVVTSVLANDNNYYGRNSQDAYRNYPADNFDVYNRDVKLHPGSTFSFNFEQTRRDQPPQIEMREENVGRYMYPKSQTTTPSAVMIPRNMPISNYHQQDHWNQQPSMVPPPPTFTFSKPNTPQTERQIISSPNWNNPTVHQNTQPRNHLDNFNPNAPQAQPLPSRPVQWTQPPKPQSTPSPYFAPTPPKRPETSQFSPSTPYVPESTPNNKFLTPPAAPTLRNRGNHKFSWDDIKKANIEPAINNRQPQVSTTPQSIHNKPPPPVPTLSPWYDNFGK